LPDSGTHTHEALFYRDDRQYLKGIARFLEPAREAGEPVALLLPGPKLELARSLVSEWPYCELLDMSDVGRNPGRVIPLVGRLHEQVEDRGMLHVIGEPIWPGRRSDEVREALRHEALVNLAFKDTAVRALCPYDAAQLDRSVLAIAERTHRTVLDNGRSYASSCYSDAIPPECESALTPPPDDVTRVELEDGDLAELRAAVRDFGRQQRLRAGALNDLLVIANELATNAYEHGAPPRRLTLWRALRHLICQVENEGTITDPLVGRRNPDPRPGHGMGLWIVHQLADLVEVRDGNRTTVRAHLAAGSAG
jgi:anti-sigma regulatory factor (Ser/Thr protein kinase)